MANKSINRSKGRARKAQQPEFRTRALWIAVGFAAVGTALSLYATNLTFTIASVGLVESSACSINEWINCDLAHASSFSRLLGIPVAWWGLLFYVFAGLAALNGVISKDRSKAASYLSVAWILSILAVLFSVYKAMNLIELGILCPICVGMYAANIGLMFALPAGLAVGISKWGDFFSNYFKSLQGKQSTLLFEPKPVMMVVTLAILFGVGYAAARNYEQRITDTSDFDVDQAVAQFFRQQPILIEYGDEPAVWGNPDAAITIVEFADFQCPACRQSAARFRPILWEFRNDVKYVFMNLPWDSAINEMMTSQLHTNAGDAARAGVCAQEFGDFWDYHDDVFRNLVSLGLPLFTRLAEDRGWDINEFTTCMARDDVTARIKRDIAVATAIGASSTPSIYVNGRKLPYWHIPEYVQAVIREEMSRL